MDLKLVLPVLERATRQWDDDALGPRGRAENAWFTLFVLRAQDKLLPPEVVQHFLELWDKYGGLNPATCTRRQLQRALNAMSDEQLNELELATRALRDEFRMRVETGGGGD